MRNTGCIVVCLRLVFWAAAPVGDEVLQNAEKLCPSICPSIPLLPIVRPSEALDRPSKALNGFSEALDRPFDALDRPLETLNRLSETLNRPTEALNRLSEALNMSSEVLDRSSEASEDVDHLMSLKRPWKGAGRLLEFL